MDSGYLSERERENPSRVTLMRIFLWFSPNRWPLLWARRSYNKYNVNLVDSSLFIRRTDLVITKTKNEKILVSICPADLENLILIRNENKLTLPIQAKTETFTLRNDAATQ